ncbi:Protein of unknown function [Pedobacter caeni]|uniref:Uncharacterized protein n=1 Tax=Pedobacter caeni TaxID=288992 RepID=A0A1M5KXK0_9SPHI|nr:Protein of unknown function [Pedobacter caeni]
MRKFCRIHVNKHRWVLELAQKGQKFSKPEDLLKNLYVFEFLVVPWNKSLLEKDLESKLIRHIEDFSPT